jgi:hypothetical protein
MTHHEWPYLTLRADGVLLYYDEDQYKHVAFAIAPDGTDLLFADAAEAEAWLVANDIRGSVR